MSSPPDRSFHVPPDMGGIVDISDLDLSGKVVIGKQVSGGATSEVFQGILENGVDTEVAIKTLRILGHNDTPEAMERLRKRFFREVLLWRNLRHPNIVPLLGYILYTNRIPAPVSPWYVNGNIVQYLRVHPASDRRSLATDVASGLEYLHSIPVAHGDIKGENALVDADSRASLCDFGLSQLLDDANRITGFTTSNAYMGGTDRYMSPELFKEEPKTTAVDIWALGCLVAQIFADKIPYEQCGTKFTIFAAIMRGDPPVRDRDRTISESLWSCIQRCWSVEPNNRPTASIVKSYLKYSARVSPADKEILEAFLLPNVRPPFIQDIVDMEKNTKSIISYFEAIERSLKMGDGLPADSPISPGHEYHLKLFSRFIAKSNSLATAIVDSCNELQTAILPFAHTLAEENVQEFVEAFAFYRSNHLTVVKITTYDANAFSVFRQQMNSFGRSLHELWGPFQEDVLEVKKRQDDLEQELSTLSKELEAIEPKISDSASLTPTTTSAASSTRSFFAAVASSWSRSDSKSRLYTELDSKIKDIIAQKQLLDLHPGYAEARVKLEAISTIQTSTVKIIDLLESIWAGAVTDCKTLRGQFDRISRARIPEVIRRELKSANTVYQLLADSLDAYAIGINEVEERLKKLV